MLNRYADPTDFRSFEDFFVGKIHGAFSRFDMEALETGTRRLVAGDIYVEVGVQYGRSTYVAACLLPEEIEMYAVDINDWGSGPDTLSRKEFWDQTDLTNRCSYTSEGSKKAAKNWDGREISMMFIDADHSYRGVKADVKNWGKFVKPGGYLYFHDYDQTSPDVVRFVNELAASDEWEDFTLYKIMQQNNTSVASLRKK